MCGKTHSALAHDVAPSARGAARRVITLDAAAAAGARPAPDRHTALGAGRANGRLSLVVVAGHDGLMTSPPVTERPIDALLSTLRAALPELRQRYLVASLAVFGSWARGEQRQDSDLDVLVEFDGPIGWQIVTLEDELSACLGIKVDLVARRGLRPRIGARILAEAVPV
jgi:predicted nucleotidyltransferase